MTEREQGLRIVAPGVRGHQISPDGLTIRSRPGAGLSAWRWQRLLIGQVLPLVAALRGFEVLHASAIVREGVAFALAGDSGVGKSSLAAHLVLRGNDLLAEDVLAVSVDTSGLPQAHVGSAALSLRRSDSVAAELIAAGRATALGTDDKEHVLVSAVGRSTPLAGVYRLRRSGTHSEPIGEPRSPTLPDLMACSFVKYLGTTARLTCQLSVQAAIARSCRLMQVDVGPDVTAARLAAALESHMGVLAREHGNAR